MFELISPILFGDLLHTWMPGARTAQATPEALRRRCVRSAGVHASSTLTLPSHYRHVIHLEFDKVPMVSPRDVVIVGYGDVHDDDSIMIYMRSVGEDEHAAERAALETRAAKNKVVRADLIAGMLFRAVDGGIAVTVISKLDLKMPFIPGWLQDLIMKHVAAEFLPMLRKQARKFTEGGELRDLLDSKPAAFAELRRRLSAMPSAAV